MKFEHHLLEGNHYEIGQKQGEIIKQNEAAVKMYTSGKFNAKKSKFANFEEAFEFYNDLCPGLKEEAEGFAESLEANLNNLFFYDFPTSIQHCSQFVAMPQITERKETLVGRSYEWNHNDEDLQLRTTKISGKYKHIGFSGMVYGRYEGLNDQGLCVTNSAGGAWSAKMENKAINWALATRVLLENCKNVEEASELLSQIPVEGSTTFILSDRSGKAILMEGFDTMFVEKHFDQSSDEKYVIATNHYNLQDNLEYNKFNNPWLLPNSQKRYEIIQKFIQEHKGGITQQKIQECLSKEFPRGICCHWYTDYFGTLWSTSFNLNTGKIEICFGPPTHNKWFIFNLDDPITRNNYEVTFPDKRIEM
jgi:predicted choloylglycine hydrolase